MSSPGDFSFDFNGRHVFVFGGTSGINLGIAQAFAQRGATVAVAGRKQEKIDAALSSLATYGGAVSGYSLDVRQYDAVAAALATQVAAHGPIDVLVSGAAGNFPALAEKLSPNGFKSVIDIDLLGTFNVLRAAWEYLRKPGASVINISAPQAQIAMAMQVHVCAAKAGVDMVTRTLAIEWGAAGVRVNSVIPGPIDGTEGMARLAPSDAARQAVVDSVPMRRMGVPADVADACLFLGSSAARYISGAILPVDGGWAANGARMALA
jgi:NAD(P)-dependent dehydrogenase (short-subunit alcohol dehydrogenase family)